MLSVDEARQKVLAAISTLEPESVPVGDAHGAVLAEDAIAPHSLPRFDNSAMDGYAVRSTDVAREGATLEIAGEVAAGDPGDLKVLPGTAVRIMTGAAVPAGADAVVPVELTDERDGNVIIAGSVESGRHVRPAGDDVASGAVVVRAGTELGAGEVAMLASLGLSPVPVRRGPRVAVLVTGDELVDPEATPGPGRIRDSNSVALRALVAEAGGRVAVWRRIGDVRDDVVRAFREAASSCDLMVSSGGVAVGKYDYVKDVVEELGGIELWRVAMQPGRPVVLGRVGERPFLGLPGNPVSIHIGFEQFVRPAIRKMRGCSSLLRPVLRAEVTEPLQKKPGRLHFVRVRLDAAGSRWLATPTGSQGSHIQSSLVGCHGVARFHADETRLERGDEVEVEVWALPGEEQK